MLGLLSTLLGYRRTFLLDSFCSVCVFALPAVNFLSPSPPPWCRQNINKQTRTCSSLEEQSNAELDLKLAATHVHVWELFWGGGSQTWGHNGFFSVGNKVLHCVPCTLTYNGADTVINGHWLQQDSSHVEPFHEMMKLIVNNVHSSPRRFHEAGIRQPLL